MNKKWIFVLWGFLFNFFFGTSGGLAQNFGYDWRKAYDVKRYDLALKINPDSQTVAGRVRISGICLRTRLDSVFLDLADGFTVTAVKNVPNDSLLPFRYSRNQLVLALKPPLQKGQRFSVDIVYHGTPPPGKGGMSETAFIWGRTPQGAPWVGTSCQTLGSHFWWPCKAAFFHPEDKADSISIALTVPDTLVAVSNGRNLGVSPDSSGWRTFRWLVTHPTSTYLITLYVGPYVELTQPIPLPSEKDTLMAHYYVLMGNEQRAKEEFFPRVPDEIRLYTRYYGPFAFASDKFGLVQSPYAGMEHSTAVAVGPIFPHTLRPGEPNPLQWYDHYFNYMVVHEVAHEWWGNAVTALDWGHFWLHEGFATYSEALWMEHKFGREALHQYMAQLSFRLDSTQSVYRPRHKTAREAYSSGIYWKGAWVLHMLRYVLGDRTFFKTLRDFNTDPQYRYHNATTADFQATCEKNYGRDLSWFFLEWIYGTGWPHLKFSTKITGTHARISVRDTSFSRTRFKMPLDVLLVWKGGQKRRRLWLKSGENTFTLKAPKPILAVKPVGLRWILDGPKRGYIRYFSDLDFVMGKFGPGLVFTQDRRLFVKGENATWISPARHLFRGARFLRLRLDTSKEPRWKRVVLFVREHKFRKRERKPWQRVELQGEIPPNVQTVRAIEYKLDFGALRGQTLPVPTVILDYR